MKQASFSPEKLVGKRVTHYIFGKGKVTRAQDDYIYATFQGVERMFEFPTAFGEYLTVEDKRLQKFLPVCEKQAPEKTAPRVRKSGFVNDEYDTVTLADMVHCTI